VVQASIQAAEKELPQQTVQAVRERATHAFEDLEAEIAKREGTGSDATAGKGSAASGAATRE
jgi:hypothetical protein